MGMVGHDNTVIRWQNKFTLGEAIYGDSLPALKEAEVVLEERFVEF